MFSFLGCNSNNAIVWGFSRNFAVAINVFNETAVVDGTTFLFPSLRPMACNDNAAKLHTNSWFTAAGFHFFIVVTSMLLLYCCAACTALLMPLALLCNVVPITVWILAYPG